MIERVPGGAILSAISFFSLSGDQRLRRLCRNITRRNYSRGHRVFEQTETAEGLYIIEEGSVRFSRTTPERRITLGEGRAAMALVTPGLLDGGPNGVTAVALTNCTICVLPRPCFYEFCRQDPHAMKALLQILSRHMRQRTNYTDLLTLATVRQRLACVLLQLSGAKGPEFVLPWSHGEIAVHIGTVREVVWRTLHKWQLEGALRLAGRSITIEDTQALRREANGFLEYELASNPAEAFIPLCIIPAGPG